VANNLRDLKVQAPNVGQQSSLQVMPMQPWASQQQAPQTTLDPHQYGPSVDYGGAGPVAPQQGSYQQIQFQPMQPSVGSPVYGMQPWPGWGQQLQSNVDPAYLLGYGHFAPQPMLMNQGFQFNGQGQYMGGGGADAGIFNGQTQLGPTWSPNFLSNNPQF
jgi:hypothetical protein